jgi:hypothetical protein
MVEAVEDEFSFGESGTLDLARVVLLKNGDFGTLTRAMIREIKRHARFGDIPTSVSSFAELHDYMDANCLGELCNDDFADALIEAFGGRDEHEGMPTGMLYAINAAQDAVDLLIKEGVLKNA